MRLAEAEPAKPLASLSNILATYLIIGLVKLTRVAVGAQRFAPLGIDVFAVLLL